MSTSLSRSLPWRHHVDDIRVLGSLVGVSTALHGTPSRVPDQYPSANYLGHSQKILTPPATFLWPIKSGDYHTRTIPCLLNPFHGHALGKQVPKSTPTKMRRCGEVLRHQYLSYLTHTDATPEYIFESWSCQLCFDRQEVFISPALTEIQA